MIDIENPPERAWRSRGGGAEEVVRPGVEVPAGVVVDGGGGSAPGRISPIYGALVVSPFRKRLAALYVAQRHAVEAAQRGDFAGARAALLANVEGWSALIGEVGAVLERDVLRELIAGRAGSATWVSEMDAELACAKGAALAGPAPRPWGNVVGPSFFAPGPVARRARSLRARRRRAARPLAQH